MAGRFLVVVAFLIEREGRLLLLRRSASKDHAPGEWEPGSGRVESGETPVAAVRHRLPLPSDRRELRLSAEHDAAD